jgi:hypothetical protein
MRIVHRKVNPSHQRKTGPDAPHYQASGVINQTPRERYSVLLLAPQYPGGPEHVVCCGNDAVAHFFSAEEAVSFCEWKNKAKTPAGS